MDGSKLFIAHLGLKKENLVIGPEAQGQKLLANLWDFYFYSS